MAILHEYGEEINSLTPETLGEISELALWAGQLLLQYGADTQRVETTIHRFGTGLGCDWLDVFVSINGIILTTSSGELFRTKLRRVVRVGAVNMGIIEAINTLSRAVAAGQIDLLSARHELEKIDKMGRNYPIWLTMLLIGVACGAFAELFGAHGWVVFALVSLASALGFWTRHYLTHLHINAYTAVLVASFVATLIASGVWWIDPAQSTIALTASVLFLVPGVALVNAIEDFISGHTTMGIARGVMGMQISLCIALGIFLAFAIIGREADLPTVQAVSNVWFDIIWAMVAAGGFAVLFNVPRRLLWGCLICGGLGHGLRYFLIHQGWGLVSSIEMATFVSATIIGLVSFRFAKWVRVPGLIFSVSGIIPMIPGMFAFGAMIGALQVALDAVSPDTLTLQAETLRYAVKTGVILISLATGLVLPVQLWNRPKPVV